MYNCIYVYLLICVSKHFQNYPKENEMFKGINSLQKYPLRHSCYVTFWKKFIMEGSEKGKV